LRRAIGSTSAIVIGQTPKRETETMAGDEERPAPSAPEQQQQEEESVHYLWREPQAEQTAAGAATTADAAAAADAADANAADAAAAAPFNPWVVEAERERESRARSRRAPLKSRSVVRVLLWAHALIAAVACCTGAAALLLATGFLLRRLDDAPGNNKRLHCYASDNPASLTVCEVATGLGALSALAWPAWVVHFLYEAATAGGPPCIAVRPRYAQMALESVLGLAWGATAVGAVSQRSGADAATMPFSGARAALAGLAPAAALLFLGLAAVDAALVFFLSESYHSGALRRDGGIYCVMMTKTGGDGEEEEGHVVGAAAAGAGTSAARTTRRRAPLGLRFVSWAPGGGARAPAAASVGSSLELF
jgi:hypothetical protein